MVCAGKALFQVSSFPASGTASDRDPDFLAMSGMFFYAFPFDVFAVAVEASICIMIQNNPPGKGWLCLVRCC
jgi:hypothetical protein